MKTPRELLFERHRATQPKLDLIRQRALAAVDQSSSPDPLRQPDAPRATWLDLFTPLRWHLAGLSAAWLLILLLNLDLDHSTATRSTAVAERTPSPRQLLATVRENRRQVLELLETPAVTAPPASQHRFVPPPRSERASSCATA